MARMKNRNGFERVRSQNTGMVDERERRLGRVEYGVDNPVPVVGGILNTRTVQSGRKLATAVSTYTKLDAPCVAIPDGFHLVIAALEENINQVFIGNKESQQYPLSFGESVAVAVMHSHDVGFLALTVGDGVKYIVESDRVID
jgi:hypothetical protein